MKSLLLLLPVLLDVVAAAGNSKRFIAHTQHESRHVFPPGWAKRDAPLDKRHAAIPLRINLRQSNLHRAEELLMGVSDPDSPKYGMHYSPDQIVDLFSPATDSVESVREWLHDAFDVSRVKYNKAKGVSTLTCSLLSPHSHSGIQSFFVNVTIAEAEDLRKSQYSFL